MSNSISPASSPTSSTSSSSISTDYDQYLRVATEKNPCILLELKLDGTIKYVSKLWSKLISNIIPDNISDIIIADNINDLNVFQNVMKLMSINKNDSYTITFSVKKNILNKDNNDDDLLKLEACGILLSNPEPYSMWILKPFFKEWYDNGYLNNILPHDFIKILGFGATIFADYLNNLHYLKIINKNFLPDPNLELCRVCENFLPNWWLETHSQICIVEHKIQSRLQLINDNLIQQSKLIDSFENLNEYKGFINNNNNNNSLLSNDLKLALLKLSDIALDIKIPTESSLLQQIDSRQKEQQQQDNNIYLNDEFNNGNDINDYNNNLLNQSLPLNNHYYLHIDRSCNNLSPQSKQYIDGINNWNDIFYNSILSNENTNNNEYNDNDDISNSNDDSSLSLSQLQELELSKAIEITCKSNNMKNPIIKSLAKDTLDLAREKVDAILRLENTQLYSITLKNRVNNYVVNLIQSQLEKNLQEINSENIQNDHIINNNIQFNNNHHNMVEITPPPPSNNDNNTTSSSNSIFYPQPKRLQHEIFSHSYLKDDEIPSNNNENNNSNRFLSPNFIADQSLKNNRNFYNDETNSNSQDTLWQSVSRSGSVTPKQQINFIDNDHHHNDSNQIISTKDITNDSDIQYPVLINKFLNNTKVTSTPNNGHSSFSSSTSSLVNPQPINSSIDMTPNSINLNVTPTSMNRSSSALNTSKLKTSIILTPRRGSPLFSASNLPNQQFNTRSNSSRVSIDKSPNDSPFPMNTSSSIKDNLMTPEQFHLNTLSSPKQPLSPLLLATNYTKPPKQSIKDYDVIKPISKGAYGSVFLARKKLTGDHVAIKVLKKSDMIAKNQIKNVKSERAIMMVQSNKPYVARLFSTFQNKDNLFLVMEYLPGGDLATLIKMMGCLPDKWARQYLSEVIVGVDDMHKNGIIHHDLKPENLLIDATGHVKLTDFGLSRAGLVRRHQRKPSKKSLSITSNNSTAMSTPTTLPIAQFPVDDNKNNSDISTPGSDSKLHSHNSTTISSKRNSNSNNTPIPPHSVYTNSLKENPEHLSNTRLIIDGLIRDRERADSVASSSYSNRDLGPNLKKTDSQTSFSLLNISRCSTPPPAPSISNVNHLQQHIFNIPQYSRTNSNVSEGDMNDSIDLTLFHPDNGNQTKNFFGTPDYLAPETISGTGEDNECDWWSVGCILFEFLLGYPPFHGETPEIVFQKILNHDIQWPNFSSPEEEAEFVTPEAKDLIENLLRTDPSKRLGANGASEIKNHPYFKEINWNTVYKEEASFVPTVDHMEDTNYFETRGAILEDLGGDDNTEDIPELFPEAVIDSNCLSYHNLHSKANYGFSTPKSNDTDSPSPSHKLSVSSVLESVPQKNNDSQAVKNVPSAIPPHMRERKNTKKINELQAEFGSFNFRNLSALDKANKDAINRLKSEHMSEHMAKKLSTSSLPGNFTELGGLKIKAGQHFIGEAFPSSSSSSSKNIIGKSDTSSVQSNISDGRLTLNTNFPSRKGSISATKPATQSPISNFSPFNDTNVAVESPLMPKYKSPLSPTINATSSSIFLGGGPTTATSTGTTSPAEGSSVHNKSKVSGKPSTQRNLSSDKCIDDPAILYAISKNNSLRYRRKSGRKSSGGSGNIRYHLDVLLCEPIPIHRYRATRDLESLGCIVVSVGNGDELVSRANSNIKFDLIITALKLPKIDAIDIIRLIKQTNGINSLTPVIAATNFSKEAENANVFNDVLEKPIQLDILRRIVSKYALQKSQTEEDNFLSDLEIL